MTQIQFKVASVSKPGTYHIVTYEADKWLCDCPHFYFRNAECVHIVEGKRTVLSIVKRMRNDIQTSVRSYNKTQ